MHTASPSAPEFNNAACVLALPLLRTPPFSGRTSVRLPTRWLVFGRVGLDGFRYLTHWVTLMSFKGNHPYSLVPDLSRHEQANGQACILKLHHGQRRISFADVEEILASQRKESECRRES